MNNSEQWTAKQQRRGGKGLAKKLACGSMAAILLAGSMTGAASAVDVSFITDKIPDSTKQTVRSVEVTTKESLIAMGFEAPEGDVGIYGILKWEGQDNAKAYDDLELAKNQSKLPTEVVFRDNNGGYNGYYEFTLYKGTIYTRKKDSGDKWRVMPMPDDIKGKITRISVDTHGMIAVDENNWVYKAQNLLADTEDWYWQTACGGLLDISPWYQVVTTEPGQWAMSCTDADYDVYYTDSKGNVLTTGGSGCTNIYYVNPEDTTEIIYDDPWLPNDESRAIASPVHGTFQIESFSASSSTLFVTNEYGDLYTRLYDFDISGGDEVFFDYTWGSNTEGTDLTELFGIGTKLGLVNQVSLPSEDWYQQPKIDGTITDRISIVTLGGNSENKLLRVEGMKNGKTGYFEKTLKASKWTFHETGEKLQGNILKNSTKDTTGKNLTEETGYNYEGKLYNATMNVYNFNYAASYQEATITVGDVTVPATLYCEYGNLGTMSSMVILSHSAGFTSDPRLYTAALYLDDDAYATLQETSAGQKFIENYMENSQTRALAMEASTDLLALADNGQLQGLVLVGTYNLERVD